MVPRTSSKAVAVVVGLWVAACAAALALATTGDQAAAQQGCGGGASPSSSPSASASEGETFPPIPTIPPSLIPVPAPDQKKAQPLDRNPSEPVRVVEVTAQQDNCPSTVTIAYESGKAPKFTGKVGSDEPMCRRARDVTVKKVKRGADPTVGKATTNAKGKYTVPARNANGRFYAKVSKATVENDEGQTITCGGARSRAIKP